jgi:hypothetical protein
VHPEVPLQSVAEGVQVGAAVVVDDALGVAGGAGGVVDRDGVPFVGRAGPGVAGVARDEKGLVVGRADGVAGGGGVVDVDDERARGGAGQGFVEDGGELAVGEEDLRLGVVEDIGDGASVEAAVEGAQDAAGEGTPKWAS